MITPEFAFYFAVLTFVISIANFIYVSIVSIKMIKRANELLRKK